MDKERGSCQGWSDPGEMVKDGQKWSEAREVVRRRGQLGDGYEERSSDRGKAARDVRNDHRNREDRWSVKARDGQMVVNWQLGSGV